MQVIHRFGFRGMAFCVILTALGIRTTETRSKRFLPFTSMYVVHETDVDTASVSSAC